MRAIVIGLAILACVGCTDAPTGPNTDVGLEVWTTLSPASLSIHDSTTPLRVRVYVRNPAWHELRVVSGGPPYVFTPDPLQSRGLWGSVRIGNATSALNAGPNVDWWGDSVYVLAPRMSTYNEFSITTGSWKSGGWPLAAGRYQVRGWFNGREGESAVLTLTP